MIQTRAMRKQPNPSGRGQTDVPRVTGVPRVLLVVALTLSGAFPAVAAEPLSKHRNNPSYLSFRGKATILVGSGEHYGAVLNPDFDQRKYLDTLAADGLDLTRLFVGTYYEKPGDFGIAANTVAPAPGRALVP